MSDKNELIKNILPNSEVHWKLRYCLKHNTIKNEYCISIELKKEKKDNYTYLTYGHHLKLIQKTPV